MTGAEFGAILVAALASGAAASLKSTAADAVSSAYEALKSKVTEILGRVEGVDALGDTSATNSEVAEARATISRKADAASESERAEIGRLIIALKEQLESHGHEMAGVSRQEINMIESEISRTQFVNESGGEQVSTFTKSKVSGSTFRNEGQKKEL